MTKKIHYCWFGNNPIPDSLQACMETWKRVMPDYEWVKWDETNFDVNSHPWTRTAYDAKKYAFVSDYVRLVALYQYGGLYFDTDVKIVKSLEPLQKEFGNFLGFENGKVITSAVMCFESGHSLIKEFLSHYDNIEFTAEIITNNEANVRMMTDILVKYGLKQDNTSQQVLGVKIFPQTYFCPLDFYHNRDFSRDTHTIHLFDASWLEEGTKRKIEEERTLGFKLKSQIIKFLSQIKHSIIL